MGGRRPPEPTPWYDRLPVMPPSSPEPGFYLYTGLSSSGGNVYKNIVMRIAAVESGFSLAYVRQSSSNAWFYGENDSSFHRYSFNRSVSYINDVIVSTGLVGVVAAAAYQCDEVTQDDIVGKIVPLE